MLLLSQKAMSEEVRSATFIIWGGSFDPEAVTRFMAVQPSQCWRKGDSKSVRLDSGVVIELKGKNEWSGWKLWLDESLRKEPLEQQIRGLADLLKGREMPLAELRAQGSSTVIDCYIGVANTGSFNLPADLLALLGNLGLTLELNLSA